MKTRKTRLDQPSAVVSRLPIAAGLPVEFKVPIRRQPQWLLSNPKSKEITVKTSLKPVLFWLWMIVCCVPAAINAADFNVTTPGFYYAINGINAENPTITLTRGVTYTFAVNTAEDHPFQIVDNGFSEYNDGVVNNNISQGTITFAVPLDAPSSLQYICSLHFFGGTINIVDPPANFHVTSPGFFYAFEEAGGENPTITLTRGVTYQFAINTDSIHPFEIVQSNFAPYTDGISNNNIFQGTITFTVPTNAPNSLRYICSLHGFGGLINVVNPPSVNVVSISLTPSNVTVKSTGAAGWAAVPEFNSNLLSATWAVVPSYTNTFSNGTNTTTFNRLEPICGPNVFLRVKNTQN